MINPLNTHGKQVSAALPSAVDIYFKVHKQVDDIFKDRYGDIGVADSCKYYTEANLFPIAQEVLKKFPRNHIKILHDGLTGMRLGDQERAVVRAAKVLLEV